MRLAEAAALDPALEEARRDAETAALHAREAGQQLRRYLQRLEVDPGRLGQLDARLKGRVRQRAQISCRSGRASRPRSPSAARAWPSWAARRASRR
jgi:hypothetical protein